MNQTIVSPSVKQIEVLTRLGVTEVPATRSEASKLITARIASRDMRPATDAQKGRASALRGRDLPGAGVREQSTAIYLLEALALIQGSDIGTAEHLSYVAMLQSRVEERFFKATVVAVVKEVPDEPALM
jgi:hypothetical protein